MTRPSVRRPTDTAASAGIDAGTELVQIGAVLRREALAMIRHLLESGVRVPPTLVSRLTAADGDVGDPQALAVLTDVHGRLADLVAPGTPRAILALQEQATSGRLRFLGPVHLARRLAVTAAVFVATFVGLSLSPWVTRGSGDLFDSSGLPLLVNLLFLMAAAGLGATFAMLFKLNSHISRRTYDPYDDTTYWMQLVLGLVAGLVLPELLTEESQETLDGLARPALALIGGFSASLVHRILSRLVETVEQLFDGSTRDLVEQAAEAARLRGAQEVARGQLQLAKELMKVQRQLHGDADPAVTAEHVQRLLDQLVGVDGQPPGDNTDAGEGEGDVETGGQDTAPPPVEAPAGGGSPGTRSNRARGSGLRSESGSG